MDNNANEMASIVSNSVRVTDPVTASIDAKNTRYDKKYLTTPTYEAVNFIVVGRFIDS
jgi:hypothetical protein